MSSTRTPSPAGAAADPAAPHPGAVYPLRPLAQDEVFLGAFSVIRRNPRAVLGLPFLAGLLNFVVSVLMMVLMPSEAYIRWLTDPLAFENQEVALAALSEGGLVLLTTVITLVGNLILALSIGLLAIPALRAAYGLPTTLGQTLTLRAGRLGWLVLHILVLMVLLGVAAAIIVVLSFLLVLVTFGLGLLLVLPGLFLLLCWLTAAFMFGPAAIVVERRNAFSAITRSFQLNRGLWWRHIGTVALLYLMLGVVLVITSLPAGLVAGVGAELAWVSAQGQDDLLVLLILGLSHAYDVVLTTLLAALVGTVLALMYLNSRFRREALDVLLIDAASTAVELPGSPEHTAAHMAPLGGARR
ncbi:hypothetical protein [Nesterenkonia alkaliphila]|uniref:Glycerophosphoryl diester phosphodiesterase membrane domain-containing protein n=1 Tax=Nesterenkonia alkaliphila TaxID=1463631 RepID=A0A7K1UK87_9MICC|nr:hypothetical protein [Nesterenkonia alkaliphila]MVT26890.1 hypothetical protein [Nesterenkonia alkaliphila]GFZ82186.1 membrane protein [Nesterenkonia alkaliphila]